MEKEIIIAVVTAVVTGAIAAFGTVAALKVHITYLREHIDRLYAASTRAHTRIDGLERRSPPENPI